MNIKAYYLALILSSNLPILHAMQDPYSPAGFITELEDRVIEGKVIYELYSTYQALSPEEQADHWLRAERTDDEIAENIAKLPVMQARLINLEKKLAKAKSNLHLCYGA